MNNNKKTFGFVCATNPFTDRYAWSGTLYKIREGIERAGYNVVWIPVRTNSLVEKIYKVGIKIIQKLFYRDQYVVLDVHRPFISWLQAKSIKYNSDFKSCDAYFFANGAQRALYMDLCGKPTVYYTDATFHIMVDYYWKNLYPKAMRQSMLLEERATQKMSLNIRSSQWAIDSVVNDCHFESKKSFVLEFGANIDSCDIIPSVPYSEGPLNILFSGVDWVRKGGDIAVETVLHLRNKGINACLTIVGIGEIPEKYKKLPFVTNVGFLNKNDPIAYKRYIECWKNAHIFLLPTQAECSAIVYCEAAAFGVPTYTYLTGGTANYVVSGENGFALDPGSPALMFASKIIEDIDSGNIVKLHNGALKMYEEKLSWDAWAHRFKNILEKVDFFND